MSAVWWLGFAVGFGVGVLYSIALHAWNERR